MHRLAKVAKEFGSEVAGLDHVRALAGPHRRILRRQGRQAVGVARHRHAAALRHRRRARQGAADRRWCRRSRPRRGASRSSFTPTTSSASRPRPISTRSTSASRSCTPPAGRWRTVRRCPRPKSWCTTSSCSATRMASTSRLLPPVAEHFERSAKPPASRSIRRTNTTCFRSDTKFLAA